MMLSVVLPLVSCQIAGRRQVRAGRRRLPTTPPGDLIRRQAQDHTGAESNSLPALFKRTRRMYEMSVSERLYIL